MIAIDTNILARLLVRDDAAQTKRVVALLRRLDAASERAFVSDVVLCELVWVLRSAYGFSRVQVVNVVERLLAARQLAFDAPDRLQRTLHAYASGRGDFADYVIREHAKSAACDTVVTFDKAVLGEAMFVAP